MIDIAVMEIENEGNLGAISRVMANFGFENLILINPKCSKDSIETIKRAKHSKNILKKVKIVKKLEGYDYVIATTAKLGTDYNISRFPLTPKQLKEKLNEINTKKIKIDLLIGREGNGLTNEEIKSSDFLVTIPADRKYPTLNISHALSIILYELSELNHTSHIIPASKKDKEVLLETINKALDKMEFTTKEKKETQKLVWKRIAGKSFLTKREVFSLIGFMKKI